MYMHYAPCTEEPKKPNRPATEITPCITLHELCAVYGGARKARRTAECLALGVQSCGRTPTAPNIATWGHQCPSCSLNISMPCS